MINPKNFSVKNWEIKTIGEIATNIYNGIEISRDQLGTGNCPAIKSGDISSKLNIWFKECVSFVNENLLESKKYFEHGDLLFASLGDENTAGKCCAYLGNDKCLAGKGITVLKHNQNPKYLAYALSSEFCRKQVRENAIEGIVFNFWKRRVEQLKIPLLSLNIQSQIANYLDKFSELIKELIKELKETLIESRKQYSYYLNSLIGRSEEEVWLRN